MSARTGRDPKRDVLRLEGAPTGEMRPAGTQAARGEALSRAFTSWLVVGLLALPAAAGPQSRSIAIGNPVRYGGGLGTAAQPYLISTAAQFNAVGATPSDWDKCFKLTANIDLRDLGATPLKQIGTVRDGAFLGIFDGNYKTVSNLRLASDGGNYLGLFGLIDAAEARVTNLTLLDPNVADDGARYVGALAGLLSNGTITNCHVRGGSIRGMGLVGGLLGQNTGGTVTDCTAAATVHGDSRVGGLAGQNLFGGITRCQAVGEVRGDASSWNIGGLIGENQSGTAGGSRAGGNVQGGDRVGGLIGENIDGLADRCYAEGTVRGTSNVGGLVGKNTAGKCTDCYAVAAVTAVTSAGSLVGYNAPSCDCPTVYRLSLIARCFAAGPVKGNRSGGLVALNRNELNHYSVVDASFWDLKTTGCMTSDGGVGKTTTQMLSLTTYTGAGWDFVGEKANGANDFWCLPLPRSYPRLAWESAMVDFNGDGRVDLRDYALLAKRWRQVDTGFWSSGRYAAPDGILDFDDLVNLADLWLAHRW